MGVDKTIQVKIRALVEGLKDVRELTALLGRLRTAPAGGAGTAVPAGSASEYDQIGAAIAKLAEKIEKLQPGKLRQLIEAGGNIGAFLSGMSRYTQAVNQLQKAKADAGNVIARATAKAREFGTTVGDKVSAGVASLSARLPSLSGGLGASAGGMTALGGAGALAATGVGAAVAVVLALVAALTILSAVRDRVIGFFSDLFQRGVAYNSNLEQTRLGIAAVIASLALLSNAQGQKLEGGATLAASYRLASTQLEKLKVDALRTNATFSQIAPAFQAAIGPGIRAGLQLDQVRETTVKIVQAASALGIPMHQVNQEVRAILEGTINEDARLAKVLGISNEMVKSWKEQGKLAEELNARLDKFALAGVDAANTLEGLKSNLQESLEVFSGAATERAFEKLKERYKRILGQIFDFDNADIDKSLKSLTSLIDDIFTRGIDLAGDFVEMLIRGLKSVARFVGENRQTINVTLDVAFKIAGTVFRIVGVLAGAAGSTRVWQGALNLTLVVLHSIEFQLRVVERWIRLAAGAFSFLREQALSAIPGLRELAFLARLISEGMGAGGRGRRLDGGWGTDENGWGTDESDAGLPTVGPPPGGGGGGKGGKGGRGGVKDKTKDALRELRESELGLLKDLLDETFTLQKDGLDREERQLKDSLDDRLISIRQFYAEHLRLQTEAIDAEVRKLEGEFDLVIQKRDDALKQFKGDKELNDAQRRTKIQAEANRFASEYSKTQTQISVLEREREQIKVRLNREERLATEELKRQSAEIGRQLHELRGDTAEAAKAEIRERFRTLRQELVKNFGETYDAVKQLDEYIRLLITHANFDKVEQGLRRMLDLLDVEERRIELQQKLEGFSDEEADRRKVAAQRAIRGELEAQLGELEAIARATKDPELIAAVERLKIEVGELGVQIDHVGREFNEGLRQDLKDTLASIITDTENAGEHLVDLARRILDRIAALVADRLVEGVFGPGGLLDGLLGGQGQQGGAGGIGGILSRILGFPQAGAGNQQQQQGGARSTTDQILSRIPGIITNFQQGTRGGLNFIGSNTAGLRLDTQEGFGRVQASLGRANELLSSIRNSSAIQAGIQTASFVMGIIKSAIAGAAGAPHAAGGDVSATPGGRLIRVAEGGYDEVVLTTDPKYSARTSRLLGAFVRRTGLLPKVPDFGARLAAAVTPSGPIAAFAAGGFVSDLPALSAPDGDVVNLYQTINNHYHGPNTPKQSDQAVKRDMSRAAMDGINRARGRRG